MSGSGTSEVASSLFDSSQAVSPGEHVKEHLASRGLSLSDLVQVSSLTVLDWFDITTGRRPITEAAAEALGRLLGPSKDFWLTLQRDYTQRRWICLVRLVRQLREIERQMPDRPISWDARLAARRMLRQCCQSGKPLPSEVSVGPRGRIALRWPDGHCLMIGREGWIRIRRSKRAAKD